MNTRKRNLALALTALLPGIALGAEGGGSNYLQGTYGDFGAGLAPKSYLRNDVILHDASIGPRPVNGGLDAGFDQDLWMDRLTIGGFSDFEILGGRAGIELTLPYVFDLTVTQYTSGTGFDTFASPRDHGFGDPIIRPQLAWGSGPHYQKLTVGIVAPWGTHDESSVVSPGRDYWSFDPTFTYGYLGDSGWDISATVGFMINLEKSMPGANYESGDEAHIDALIGKHFGEHFSLGIAGYWYHQLDDDKGFIPRPPLDLGYQGDLTGYGPVLRFGNKNVSVVAKWLRDDYADNHLEGDLYMLSFVAHFGGAPAPAPAPVAPPPVAQAPPPPPPPPPPPDADGDGVTDQADLCPATPSGARVDVNGCSCDFTIQVHFKSNSTEITGADAITLDSLADQVRKLPTITGELGGHTDSQGAEAFNVDLSRRRALAVRDYLASRGINVSQLAVKGLGESEPVADNTTVEGRAQNRRVVLSRTNCLVGPKTQ